MKGDPLWAWAGFPIILVIIPGSTMPVCWNITVGNVTPGSSALSITARYFSQLVARESDRKIEVLL